MTNTIDFISELFFKEWKREWVKDLNKVQEMVY